MLFFIFTRKEKVLKYSVKSSELFLHIQFHFEIIWKRIGQIIEL